MTLVLQWRQPDPPIVTRWRGDDGSIMEALAYAPQTPIAAIIGPPGPGGGGGSGDVISPLAAATIGALKAVYVSPAGAASLADKDGLFDAVGVSITSATLGNPVTVQVAGFIDDLSWNWAAGPVWLGTSGQLTQAIPVTGALVKIGMSAGASRLIVQPEFIATLN